MKPDSAEAKQQKPREVGFRGVSVGSRFGFAYIFLSLQELLCRRIETIMRHSHLESISLVVVAASTTIAPAILIPIPTIETRAVAVFLYSSSVLALLLLSRSKNSPRFWIFAGLGALAFPMNLPAFGTCLAFSALLFGAANGVAAYLQTQRVLRVFSLVFAWALFVDSSGVLWPQFRSFEHWIASLLTGVVGDAELLGSEHSMSVWLVAMTCCLGARLVVTGAMSASGMSVMLFSLSSVAIAIILDSAFIACVGVVAGLVLDGALQSNAPPIAAKLNWKRILSGTGLLVFGVSIICLPGSSLTFTAQLKKSITVVTGGMASFETVTDGELPPDSDAPRFGGFLALLSSDGWEVECVDQSNFQGSPSSSVTLFVNPTTNFSVTQLANLGDYVRSGGRLLVLGDHTDIGGIMQPLNSLLATTDIEFAFDSAIPFDEDWKWKSCLRGSIHSPFRNTDNGRLKISVGASLKVWGRGRVLVEGTNCFSDIGRPDFGVSKLGDMAYSPGELKGGLALVAQQQVEKGLVQVWGDTAGFQDSSIASSGAFHLRNMRVLLKDRWVSMPAWIALSAGTLAVLSGFMVLQFVPWASAVLSCCLIGLAGVAYSTAWESATCAHVPDSTIIFDTSHSPKFPSFESGKSINRLSAIAIHCGSVLLKSDSLSSSLRGCPSMIVIPEPQDAYSTAECDELLQYLNEGGSILVFSSASGARHLEGLLKPSGIRITTTMCGAAHNNRVRSPGLLDEAVGSHGLTAHEPPPQFDADLVFRESHALDVEVAESLVDCWGFTLIAQRQIGAGRLTVIGDNRFLLDECLEVGVGASRKYQVKNATFVSRLLKGN